MTVLVADALGLFGTSASKLIMGLETPCGFILVDRVNIGSSNG